MDTLFVPQIVKVKVILAPSELNHNYEQKLRDKIKNKYGDSCYLNGFIRKSSIELVKISNGVLSGSHLRGHLTFNVEFKALFCIPQKGKSVRCRIKNINKFGAMAELYPMDIIIPRKLQQQIHQEVDIFASLKERDYVYVKILNHEIRADKLVVIGTIIEVAIDKPNSLDLPGDALILKTYTPALITGSTPPDPLSILGNNESLNNLKDKITGNEKIWESRIRYLISPYELIDIYRPDVAHKYNKSIIKYDENGVDGLYPVFSRAYFKLWEILSELKVLDPFKDKAINIANLAEGPGGFIHCLFDFRNRQNGGNWKNDNYNAITLKSGPTNNSLDWQYKNADKYFKKIKSQGYQLNLSYGNGDGNLLDISNIQYFSDKDLKGQKCALVTADGGIELSGDAEYSTQEIANGKLFFAEILTALTIQENQGSFILKIYDIYYRMTLQFITLLSIYYDQVTVIKPRTSRPANSEKYIVCRGFNGIAPEALARLYDMFSKWIGIETVQGYLENKEYVHSICTFVDDIEDTSSTFKQNIVEFNDYNVTMQLEKINEGLNLIANKSAEKSEVIRLYKENQKDLAIKWCQQFGIPYLPNVPLSEIK